MQPKKDKKNNEGKKKNKDAQKKRFGHKVPGVSLEAGGKFTSPVEFLF